MQQKRWAVFISGRGSNLAALVDLRQHIDIALVVSSSAKAHGLLRARRAGVPTWVVSKPIDWIEVDRVLRSRGITNIVLAGFMRIVPGAFVALWEGRIANLHPSLLPAYPGLDSIARAYNEGADIGVSVHVVNEGVDEGPVVAQRRSLKQPKENGYSLDQSELIVHIDEQRLLREAILKWNQ